MAPVTLMLTLKFKTRTGLWGSEAECARARCDDSSARACICIYVHGCERSVKIKSGCIFNAYILMWMINGALKGPLGVAGFCK